MSRPLTEYTDAELLEAHAAARRAGDAYDDILAEMNRRLAGRETMVRALKFWTVVTVVMVALLFVAQPTCMGCATQGSGAALMPMWLPSILAIAGLWFVGVIGLLVASALGAFRPAGPSSTAGSNSTKDRPADTRP